MSEFDELLDEVLTEGAGDPRPVIPTPSVSTEDRQLFKEPFSAHESERAGGVRSSSREEPAGSTDGTELEPEGSVGQSADVVGPEAPGDAIGTPGQEVGLTARSRLPKARRGMARQRERSGLCPMYAPRGTICKSCGKVHPL